MLKLTLYSRKDCHLCDLLNEILMELKCEIPFSLAEVDIERDNRAFEKYKHLIPVFEIDTISVQPLYLTRSEPLQE